MRFEFATATRIIFGAGTLRELNAIAKEFGKRPVLITGSDPRRAERVLAGLAEQRLAPVVFSVNGEPETSTIENAVALAKSERCDFVIAFGGGSAIDSGKATAAMLNNPGQLKDYLEVIGLGKTLPNRAAPFIAIPTTAGTGSEVTRNAVLASAEHRVKVSLRSPHLLAKVALVDPELTHGLPPALTASTGFDALTQLIEPYVCSRANPMVDALCVEGIGRVARSLRTATWNGADPMARQDMALASLFGGLALANAGLGAVHGFAGPIGGMFPAPHGAICAALLAPVMEVNLRALSQRQSGSQALARYAHVARVLTSNPESRAEDGIDWVRQLVIELKIPKLAQYGVTERDIPELVEKAEQASSMKTNPIVLSRVELAEALEPGI